MHHQAGAMVLLRQFPEFFQTEPECLRRTSIGKPVARDKLLGQRTACAFGDQYVLSTQSDSRRVVRLAATVACDAEIAGYDAGDLSPIPEFDVHCGKARIDFHP